MKRISIISLITAMVMLITFGSTPFQASGANENDTAELSGPASAPDEIKVIMRSPSQKLNRITVHQKGSLSTVTEILF